MGRCIQVVHGHSCKPRTGRAWRGPTLRSRAVLPRARTPGDRRRHARCRAAALGGARRSGLVDPLFISFPTQVAQAGWQLSHDRDFWNDVEVSATEFILGYGAALALAIPLGLAVGLSKRLQYMIGPFVDTLNAVPRVTLLP